MDPAQILAEAREEAKFDEDGEVRCGYCGEFTPHNGLPYHDIICECCGRLVATCEFPEKEES